MAVSYFKAKLPPKSETAPHPGWQDGTILQPGEQVKIATHSLVDVVAWEQV